MTKKSNYISSNMKGAYYASLLWAFVIDALLWTYICLVSYKIIYQKLIISVRYPTFSWNAPLYSLTAGALIALILFPTSLSIGKAVKGMGKDDPNSPLMSRPSSILALVIISLTFITGLFVSQVSMQEFFSSSGIAGAKRIFSALLSPNWDIFVTTLAAAVETIYMAFIATTAALPVAFLMSFFAARNLMKDSWVLRAVYAITRFVLNISRSIEPLVWAIIFSVWVGIGPFAGMLALAIHSVASLAKLYSEQIENIDNGPIEAMMATGAHPIQVVWYGVVPQIVLPYLSYTIYRWDINVRMATVIGLVGGGGIGTMLMQYQGLAKWNEVGLLIIVIAAIVWSMDWASARIREAIQ